MSVRRVPRRKTTTTLEIQLPKIMFYDCKSYGLCNQLFCIACSLADAINANANIAFQGFYPEMTSANHVSIERLLNLTKTNENLAAKHIKVLVRQSPNGHYNGNDIFPKTPWQVEHRNFCLRALVFSDEIVNAASSLCLNEPFYCVHFRLDIDVVICQFGGLDVYHKWLHLTDERNEVEARKIATEHVEQHRAWIREPVGTFVEIVRAKCTNTSAPIIVLTPIGKPMVLLGQNDLMEWAFQEFQQSLAPPRRVVRNTGFASLGREYSAAVELNIACDSRCIGFIGSVGSTFSDLINMRIDAAKQLGCV